MDYLVCTLTVGGSLILFFFRLVCGLVLRGSQPSADPGRGRGFGLGLLVLLSSRSFFFFGPAFLPQENGYFFIFSRCLS